MKFLLLSLLPLAADLAYARPAQQDAAEALAKRLSPLPNPHRHIVDEPRPDLQTKSNQPFSYALRPGFDAPLAKFYLGLADEEVTDFQNLFINHPDFSIVITGPYQPVPGATLPLEPVEKRLSPPAEEQTRPEQSFQDEPTSEVHTLWDERDPTYADTLRADLESGSVESFLGLDDEEIAQLQNIFTDDKERFSVATQPPPKVDGGLYDFPTASGDSDLLADLLAEFGDNDLGTDKYAFTPEAPLDDKGVEGDKSTIKYGLSPNPIIAGNPVFDPSNLEIFDANGLPSVTFKEDDAYAAKIVPSLLAATPNPLADYSQFVPPYTQQ